MPVAILLLRLLVFLWGTSLLALSLLYVLGDLPRLLAAGLGTEVLDPVEVVFKLLWPVLFLVGVAMVRVALRPTPTSSPAPEALEVRPDVPLALTVGVALLAAALPCLATLGIQPLPLAVDLAAVGLAATLLWKGGTLVLQALRGRPILWMDSDGIRAPASFPGVLPWASIRAARLVPGSSENLLPTFLTLSLRPTSSPTHPAGSGRISLHLSLLEVDPRQLLAFVHGRLGAVTDPGVERGG